MSVRRVALFCPIHLPYPHPPHPDLFGYCFVFLHTTFVIKLVLPPGFLARTHLNSVGLILQTRLEFTFRPPHKFLSPRSRRTPRGSLITATIYSAPSFTSFHYTYLASRWKSASRRHIGRQEEHGRCCRNLVQFTGSKRSQGTAQRWHWSVSPSRLPP